MNVDLANEYETVRHTNFWQIFWKAIEGNRDAAAKKLQNSYRISEPAVQGDVMQERLRVFDQILAAPSRIIENK